MNKKLLSLIIFPVFLLVAPPAFADDFGTFTASNVTYNPITHNLSFHASNFSQPVTQVIEAGITNCNTPGCSVAETEFFSHFELTPLTDPYDFNVTPSLGSYIPSSGTVYVEFSDAGATYQRMWSQALNYNDIISLTPTPTQIPSPTNKDDCKKGGWESFLNLLFKNQGNCVSSVNKNK
jgi:hypothetical protein